MVNNIMNAPKKTNYGIKSRNEDCKSIQYTLNADRPSTPNQPTSKKTVEEWSKDLFNKRKNKEYNR